MSLVLAYGRYLFSETHNKFLIFSMLGWLLYTKIISLNCHFILRCLWRISLWQGFFCQTIFLLHSYSSSCSLLIRLLSFFIPMNSMEIEPPLVKEGLTVHQNCLLAIILFAFCGLIQKIYFCFFGQRIKFIFGSLIKNKISPWKPIQMFFVLDLLIIALLWSWAIKGTWFPLNCFSFGGGVMTRHIVKNVS